MRSLVLGRSDGTSLFGTNTWKPVAKHTPASVGVGTAARLCPLGASGTRTCILGGCGLRASKVSEAPTHGPGVVRWLRMPLILSA